MGHHQCSYWVAICFGRKPLPEPMLTNHWWIPLYKLHLKFWYRWKQFLSEKWIWKCRLPNCGHFHILVCSWLLIIIDWWSSREIHLIPEAHMCTVNSGVQVIHKSHNLCVHSWYNWLPLQYIGSMAPGRCDYNNKFSNTCTQNRHLMGVRYGMFCIGFKVGLCFNLVVVLLYSLFSRSSLIIGIFSYAIMTSAYIYYYDLIWHKNAYSTQWEIRGRFY